MCSSPILLLLCPTVPNAASHALVPFPLTPKAAAHRVGLGKGRAGLGWAALCGWSVGSRGTWVNSPLRSRDHVATSLHKQGLHPTCHFCNLSTIHV